MSEANTDDLFFMEEALRLAARGWGFTSPNPMVGAVVVKDGEIVGRGYHQAAGKAHAEVNALNDAGEAARDATLYVTLEPCNHTGRTPPCTRRILQSGVRRVVCAMEDPNPNVTGGGVRYLQANGVSVDVGVGRKAAEKQNEAFIKFIKTKTPFVVLKCAMTLDGYIATHTGDSKWVTGEAAREHVHWLRHGMDGIMVGVGTIVSDDPSLTTRLPEGMGPGKDPARIILDSKLSIPEDARVLGLESNADTILVTGAAVSKSKKGTLKGRGVKVLEAPLIDGRINLALLMGRLGYIGITSLLIEGGSRVAASAIQSRIVDKVIFFYAPKLLGGSDGFPLCSGPGPDLMRQTVPLRDVEVRRFGEDILVEGYLDKSKRW